MNYIWPLGVRPVHAAKYLIQEANKINLLQAFCIWEVTKLLYVAKTIYICDKIVLKYMRQSIDNKVLEKIKKCGRGRMFFSSDFASYGGAKSVLKALERLTKAKVLLRLSQGIYYYPKMDKELGIGVLYPSLETIASAIAKRDKARIVPTGLYALNRLGLSTQVPMNIVYLTDGTPRKINIANGRGILFKRAAPKNFSFHSELVMLIVFALKELKQENVTSEHLEKIKQLLQQEPKEKVMADAALMPAWIKTIIMKSYE
jgi:hypothetical protein